MSANGRDDETTTPTEDLLFPWQKGWSTLKSIWPQLVYISIGSIAIPQFVLSWVFSIQAIEVGSQLSGQGSTSFSNTLKLLESFSSLYFGMAIIAVTLGLVGYLSVVALTFQSLYRYRANLVFSIKTGIKTTFPFGIIGLILILGLSLFGLQILLLIPSLQVLTQLILLVISVLLTAWPILLVESPRNPARTIMSALKLRYAVDTGITKWSVFFTLLTYYMALLSLFSLISILELQLLNLDQRLHIPRELWMSSNSLFPTGFVSALVSILGWLLISLCLTVFAVFSTSYLFDLKQAALRKISKIEVLV